MDTQNHIIEHRKGQHLLAEERHEIEVRLKDGWSPYQIAKHLGRAYNTIKDEIARGTVYSHDGKAAQYNAEAGEQQYKENRRNSRRQYKQLEVSPFIEYVEENFAEGWSLDVCVNQETAEHVIAMSILLLNLRRATATLFPLFCWLVGLATSLGFRKEKLILIQ